MKGAFINLLVPSVLIDKNFRSLPHPSFYETGNLLLWLKIMLDNSQYHKYLFFSAFASITSIFTVICLIIGPYFIFKENKTIFILTILYTFYFLVITGPVVSPKYIFPILPCMFLFQGITLYKLQSILIKKKP